MSEQLMVDVRAEHDALRLCLRGPLDISTVDILRTCLEAVDDDVPRVILDLRDLEFLDSTGLNLFVHTHRRFGPGLRELVIANPQATARRILEVSGVDRVIPITDSVLDEGISEPA